MKHTIKATIYDRKGQIVSQAENSYKKTHPLQAMYASQCGEPYKVYLHAEIAALVKAKGKGYKIHVERHSKAGMPLLAQPCPICMLAIKEAGIKVVSFTLQEIVMEIQHIKNATLLLKEADNSMKEAFGSSYAVHNYKNRIDSLIKDCEDIIDYINEYELKKSVQELKCLLLEQV